MAAIRLFNDYNVNWLNHSIFTCKFIQYIYKEDHQSQYKLIKKNSKSIQREYKTFYFLSKSPITID